MKKETSRQNGAASCGTCAYYVYDDDISMDEDEYIRLISDQHYECPYYRNGDDYRIVRKQM